MGIECSCFRSDYGFGSVEISEKAVVVPFFYESTTYEPDLYKYLKSLSRGYLIRKQMKIDTSPSNLYQRSSLPITAYQTQGITNTQLNRKVEDFQLTSPVYIIEDTFYQGSFNRRGMKHGKGILVFPDKRKYIGNFKLNNIEGVGVMVFDKGDVYEGEFIDNQAHGKGKFIQSNGSSYEGGFKNDKQSGIGKEI